MEFINNTNNTVYLQDIDRYVPFIQGQVESIDEDDILKSQSFQQMVLLGAFEIVSIGKSRIEKNLERLNKQMSTLRKIQASPLNAVPIVKDESLSSQFGSREVFIKGHFLEAGGYAKYNRNIALGLKALGVDVKVEVVGGKNQLNELEVRQVASMQGKPGKDAIKIDSMIPSFGNLSAGRNSILYTTIESYTVPQQFIDIARSYKEIWVTSDFCKEILVKSGIRQPIYVMPCSVNKSIYTPDGDEYEFRPKLKPFVFVSVFGWSYRKGYDVLLRSYLEEFSGEEDVSLLLVSKVANDSGKSDIIRGQVDKFIKECRNPKPPHIVRCSRNIPEANMPSLYRACDAFVLFSRGEGFGLPYCEASLCGLPVIGSNCSAQTMFLNKDNSYLLEVDSLQRVDPGTMHVHYWDNQEFPSFKSSQAIKDARALMREVYENHDKAKQKNKKLRNFILSNYSVENVVGKIKNRLDEIWSGQ